MFSTRLPRSDGLLGVSVVAGGSVAGKPPEASSAVSLVSEFRLLVVLSDGRISRGISSLSPLVVRDRIYQYSIRCLVHLSRSVKDGSGKRGKPEAI